MNRDDAREERPEFTGCLTRTNLIECMERPNLRERLVVTPLLNPRESLGVGSVDVRLGGQFIVMKRESFRLLDVGAAKEFREEIRRYQERVVRNYREPFVLHPRELVIGSTLEYVQVPGDLMCYVIGKSSWGRMGLIIATATKVDPGFRGCVTLEILNEGEVPLVLYPGLPVAQLVFHRTEGVDVYDGSYICPIGPEFPRFELFEERWRYWIPSVSRRS